MCAALKQLLAAEVVAAASSSSRVVSDGPRRRVLLPKYTPQSKLPLNSIEDQLAGHLLNPYMEADALPSSTATLAALPGIAKQVARELVVEKGSAGYGALVQAALSVGTCQWWYASSMFCLSSTAGIGMLCRHTCTYQP